MILAIGWHTILTLFILGLVFAYTVIKFKNRKIKFSHLTDYPIPEEMGFDNNEEEYYNTEFVNDR